MDRSAFADTRAAAERAGQVAALQLLEAPAYLVDLGLTVGKAVFSGGALFYP